MIKNNGSKKFQIFFAFEYLNGFSLAIEEANKMIIPIIPMIRRSYLKPKRKTFALNK